ncbi:MAG: hypothetical protein B7X53_16580 [Hyphomonas sp. 34-62-18]|nr:hypothetical protein [Hyphomonas sp. 34-62-18]OZB13215.1 MAG: hypothetical protein B7X53_16580 [Hyphomonas sp. 34-62-18]
MKQIKSALILLVMAGALAAPSALPQSTEIGATAQMPIPESQTLPADAILLQRAIIRDPGVVAQMDALTILVPDGWTTQGGIVQQQDRCSEVFGVDWSATSPDGGSSMFIFPTEGWQASTTPMNATCPYATFTSAEQYLSARVQASFPNARLTAYRPREDYTKAAAQQARDLQMMANQAGVGMRVWADGGEVEFTFSGQNGAEMQGLVAVTATFMMSEPLYNPMGGPPLQTLSAATLGTFGAVAPRGELNVPLAEAVRRSLTPQADWLEKLFAIKAQLGQMAARNTEERAAMIVAGGAAATKRNIETYRKMAEATRANGIPDPVKTGSDGPASKLYTTDETEDRIQRESIEGIRGVETYLDPVDGHQVQLDATYDNAWRITNQDAYILTNDPNFNPGLYNIEATQLKTVR